MIHTRAASLQPDWPEANPGNHHLLAQRVYRFRVLDMALAALPLAMVLTEQRADWLRWSWLALSCLVWPHLARVWTGQGEDSHRRERINLLLDSVIAGSWIALLHFNILPSVLIITLATADKINTGVRGLWWRSVAGMGAAIALVAWANGFAFEPQTSMLVLLACVPLLFFHTLGVSMMSHGLIRRVQSQYRELNALSRLDALTGLDQRGYWQEAAGVLLRQHHVDGGHAVLMMVDVDHFKDINDVHGHVVGDDVLRAIAIILRRCGPAAHIGRFGGDEFALVVALTQPQAMQMAEQVRRSVERMRLPHAPALTCSVSIGMAAAADRHASVRAWIEAADRPLYRAKHAGRNRTASEDLRAVG